MTDFQIGGIDFFFDEDKKICTLRTNFSKATKNKPLEFHFSKGADKNLRVQIPVIFRGGRRGVQVKKKKKERPNGSLCPNWTDTSAMIQHLKHESNSIEFESKAQLLKFYLLVQF